MANQPLAFGGLLVGGIAILHALSGDSLANVVAGKAKVVSNQTGGSGAVNVSSSLGAAVNAHGGYVSPFAAAPAGNLTPERIDQGQDFSLHGGDPIVSIANSKLVGIMPNWYKGQPYLNFQFLDGPRAGQYWYMAEAITPTVKVGDVVPAGAVIGHYNSGGTGLEAGFGTATAGRTLAQATTGYTEGQITQAGKEFSSFLNSIMAGAHV